MERHFDEELKELKEKLLHMAALAEQSVAQVINALVKRDSVLAEKVIEDDNAINILDIEIDEICLGLLAIRQPMAKDLRFITSAMKINSDLERIGDLSVNIAQSTLQLLKEPVLKPLIDIPRMAELAQKMLRDSLDAFVYKNETLAREVCRRDDEVDKLNHQIFRELITYMMQDSKNINRALGLVLIGRNLERVADHATNIAEDVIYIVNGKTIKHHVEESDLLN